MARLAIHPGEQLAEELRALDMSAAELARQLKVPTNRVTGILQWAARHYRRYRPAPRPFLRHESRILAQPAEPLRAAARQAEGGQDYQGVADAQAPEGQRCASVRERLTDLEEPLPALSTANRSVRWFVGADESETTSTI